ncbi:MAG: hypothetical protein GY899_10920 [Verrucomicrobiaceae bacterium]|nr:hypothetical protein [Verrucomicrobiaceae bacterium]
MLIIFTALYLYLGRHLINQTNGDRNRSDQQNNIRLALKAKELATPDFSTGLSQSLWKWFPHHTDGVVNPLWPWLAARIHLENQSEEDFFVRGKWLNIWLTLGILLTGAGILSKYFSLPATLNFLLLAGLGSFLPRAVWFQPEPLYFILFLAAWVCALMTLLKNSLWRYTLFGIITGLAYLTKASALPLMAAFLGISTLRFLLHWISRAMKNQHHATSAGWNSSSHVLGSLLCILAFLMTAGPLLNSSYKRFGNIFDNYPGYWMWMDNFEPQGIDFLVNYNTREKLESIPENEKPSLALYLRTHSANQATERLKEGIKSTGNDFLFPKRAKIRKAGPDPWRVLLPSRGIHLISLAGILSLILFYSLLRMKNKQPDSNRFPPGTLTIVIFVLTTLIGYLILFSWYRPIGKGDRFMLSLYAPVALSLIWAAESVYRRIGESKDNRLLRIIYCAAHLGISSTILWRIYELANHPVFFTK